MIEIIIKDKEENRQIFPTEMLSSSFSEGQVFQQYFNNVPQKDYYINCGFGESSVIHIWYSDESRKYALSTDDRNSLSGLNKTVMVVPIDAKILITLEMK